MATVTSTVAATCHYWFSPQPVEDITGSGVTVGNIIHGWAGQGSDDDSGELNVDLDSSLKYDIVLEFRGAPPIIFCGFEPGSGGDLLTMLAAQGWESL